MSHSPICPCPNCKGSGRAIPVAGILAVAGAAYVWHELHVHSTGIGQAVKLAGAAILLACAAGSVALWRYLARGQQRRAAAWQARQVPQVRARVRPQVQLRARRGRGEVSPPARAALSQGTGSVSSQVNDALTGVIAGRDRQGVTAPGGSRVFSGPVSEAERHG